MIFGRQWFGFLLLSPSYELARRHRVEGASANAETDLPADFDVVLRVFDDLGDVGCIGFDDWWLKHGIRHFGYQGERLSVHVIDLLSDETDDPGVRLGERAKSYIDSRWHEQGRQDCFVVSIPLGLPKSRVIDQVSALLSDVPDARRVPSIEPPKYRRSGTRLDIESLFRYWKCLVYKAHYPEAKLYEIGVLAELSSTYSSRIAGDHYNGQPVSVDDRHALKILTSRAINRGMMIAENAARGVFPSYTKNIHAVSPKWDDIAARLTREQDWDERQE